MSIAGKLIVATNAEEDAMLAGVKRGPRRTASRACACSRLPRRSRWSPITCRASALLSPATGIVDSHAFMLALQGDAENAGAAPVFFSP